MNKSFVIITDIIFSPFTLMAAVWFKFIRKYNVGLWHTVAPVSKAIFEKVGVFPIMNHYYEPLFNSNKLKRSLRDNRNLPGIDLNEMEQLEILSNFHFNNEIIEIFQLPKSELNYPFPQSPFASGDSEILFNMIRRFKPEKIIEIGCGYSSLMIQHAIKYNKQENGKYLCEHICIEPYPKKWLAKLDAKIISQQVENTNVDIFKSLNENDILFIDSTHIIRPQGDVLFEYLEILPVLKIGVLVHIHDIFTPKDYLNQWLKNGVNFWNEQYLLEAFLSCNNSFKIISAVNFLKHKHFDSLKAKCPILTAEIEPGSFWIRKIE